MASVLTVSDGKAVVTSSGSRAPSLEEVDCPNCGDSVHKSDLARISIGCVVRHYARESGKMKRLAATGHLEDLELSEIRHIAGRDQADGWVKLPPVLERLRYRVSDVDGALARKTIRVCSTCHSTLLDTREVEDAAARDAAAALVPDPRGGVGAISAIELVGGTRAPNPAIDMVIRRGDERIRERYRQRHEKEQLRTTVHPLEDLSIDWSSLPRSGQAARDLLLVLREGADGLRARESVAIRLRMAKRYGNAVSRDPDQPVDFSEDLAASEFLVPSSSVAALQHQQQLSLTAPRPATTSRSLSNPPRTPSKSRRERATRSMSESAFSPTAPATTEDVDCVLQSFVDHGGNTGEDVTWDCALDLPLSHTLQYELWAVMTNVCPNSSLPGAPWPKGDHPVDAPAPEGAFFAALYGESLRFPDPPTRRVEEKWRAEPITASARRLLAGFDQSPPATTEDRDVLRMAASTANVAQQAIDETEPGTLELAFVGEVALRSGSRVLEELTVAEHTLLGSVVGEGAAPPEQTELTPAEIAFIEGGKIPGRDTDFDEEDEEEWDSEEWDDEEEGETEGESGL